MKTTIRKKAKRKSAILNPQKKRCTSHN